MLLLFFFSLLFFFVFVFVLYTIFTIQIIFNSQYVPFISIYLRTFLSWLQIKASCKEDKSVNYLETNIQICKS